MTIPPVPTAAINQPISSGWWNNSAAPPIEFLMNPPKCSVYNNSGQNLSSGNFTLITYDSEAEDSDNMHSTSVNPSRITFNTPGRYTIDLFVSLPTAALTQYAVQSRVNAAGNVANGSTVAAWPWSTGPRFFTVSFSRVFAAGDHLETWVQANTTGPTDVGGQWRNGTQARWVSIN